MRIFGLEDSTTLCNCGQKVKIPSQTPRTEIVMNILRKMILIKFLGKDMNVEKDLGFTEIM